MANITTGKIIFLICFMFVSGVVLQQPIAYDFESVTVPTEITPTSSLRLSTTRHKYGSKSLEWQWNPGQQLTWDLSSNLVDLTRNGGIKFWIYSSNRLPNDCLLVCIRIALSQTVSCFSMSLNFQGWRAAWVAYREFIGCPSPPPTSQLRGSSSIAQNSQIDQLYFRAPSRVRPSDPLHIDTLQFVRKISKFTRDLIVPPLTYYHSGVEYCTSCARISSGLGEQDALNVYSRKQHWQQIYRWSLRTTPLPNPTLDVNKLRDINKITRRLMNWYANERKVFAAIPHTASPTDSPFLEHRWNSLLKTIDRAHRDFKKLSQTNQPGTPTFGLFARNSGINLSNVHGAAKRFAHVFHQVLLPLALEHYIKSRPIEVDYVTCEFAKNYSCGNLPNRNYLAVITGRDSVLKRNFISLYNLPVASNSPGNHPTCLTATISVTQDCFDHIKNAIDGVNANRLAKILNLFNYIKDQGWDKGSALGSFDHEILGMSGFAHSMFLMRNQLKSGGKLDAVIDAMKWYTEFGEVYQAPFEYKGTTADRARSIMLFRLLTVLAMPDGNNLQKREKIRDMDALQSWINNALTINEGLDGLIKPDFTCFHHRTFYAAAYCPSALHQATLVSFMLAGTRYELNRKAKGNLVDALKVFRIVAINYSTPSQVGGRMPSYANAVLAEHVPAYAYIAANPRRRDITLNYGSGEVRMFLRLYQYNTPTTCTGIMEERLCRGSVPRIYYLNTLGSLEIMHRVKVIASRRSSNQNRAEQSPNGHWSKQFAALSIHRRSDWAVTVKGFDKYVWDYEMSKSPSENRYGMYTSHGAMLIANSGSALSSKDVDNGWNWRKIPGTTVIDVDDSDMLIDSDRHYSTFSEAMAGGVTFKGSKSQEGKNGVFGMNFKQPNYIVTSGSPFENIDFLFKKSVFFYDEIIVSLGSNIQYNGGQKEIHTALFQDKMLQNPSPLPSQSDVFRCNDGGPLSQTSWPNLARVVLVDVNGNRYYIPDPDRQGLVFMRDQRQNSFKSRGKNVNSQGIYCTAWFNHGTNPSPITRTNEYEYAVQVEAERVGKLHKSIIGNLRHIYQIIKQDEDAHVVKFHPANGRGTVYGYVVFPISPAAPGVNLGGQGPVESVRSQSIIMVEEITTAPEMMYISVTSPQLKLRVKQDAQTRSKSWCQGGNMSPSKYNEVDESLLFCSISSDQMILVNLRNNAHWSRLESLYVNGEDKTNIASHYLVPTGPPTQNPLTFIHMTNGESTEVLYKA